MKKIGLLLLGLTLIAATATAQMAIENFDYAAGALTTNGGANVSGGTWANISGTAGYLNVIDGNLSYAGYPSSGIGRMLQLVALTGSGEDAAITFATQTASTTIYASMLVNVDDLTGLAPNSNTLGDYIAMFLNTTSTTNHYARLQVRLGSSGTTYQLGIRASSSNAATEWYTTDLNPGQTYYVVVGLQIVSGTTNDVANLWVNPAESSTPPSPNATQVSGVDATNIARFVLRQGTTGSPVTSTTPNAKIDGLRISDLWSDIGLPVQLASFAAIRVSDDVQLSWSTISEVNNFGFYVERKLDGTSSFVEVPNSFIAGHATTLEPQSYSFTDNTVTPGVWYYRLRQVDLDGKINYSEPVKVEYVTAVTSETPATYGLSQNYPNPFNPSTDIQFSLAKAGTVSLKVYDMLGREVATLANGEFVAGVHHVMFNAINLPSGAYFYALKAGNFSAMKSMMLVK